MIGIIGCGWLGRALAARLVSSGARVLGTTTSSENAAELQQIGVEPVLLRFAPDATGDVEPLREADAFIVAIPPGRGPDPVAAARSAAGLIRETSARQVIQISTSSVYPNSGGRVTEKDAIPDHRLYLVEDAYRELDCATTILRCTGLFGPGRLILPYVLSSGSVVDPDVPVNLVEQSDVVGAVMRVLDEPVEDTFNVCADEHPTRGEFYREIARRSGLGVPEFRRSGESYKIVDNGKFKERFGFRYAYPDPLQFPV